MGQRLQDMAIGETGVVLGFTPGNKSYRQRLLAIGLTPGTEFVVVRYAPLGDEALQVERIMR